MIVITEFMAEDAIHGILGSHHMRYDAELVDRRDDLLAAVATADALIVRNRTRVNAALGMSVCAFDPLIAAGDAIWGQPWGQIKPCDLRTLLGDSDVVSLHVPLTDAARNMIDARAIAGMKRGTILINAARGGVVDEAAMVVALRAGQLGGAALDVFAQEPLTKEGGALFAGCPNLILTPHIAGVTVEANIRVSRMVAQRIRDHLAGDS